MAIDFMTALRSRARAQERSARLSGRPLTQEETIAPYVALAETASERMARERAQALEQKGQEIQQGQFGETLEFNRQTQAENARMEAERLAEQKRAEEERIRVSEATLAEQQRATNLQVAAAQEAGKRDEKQSAFGGAAAGAYVGFQVGGPPGAAIGAIIGYIGSKKCCFIFIASHGYLHPIVRKYRDEHMTDRNRRGYYWLADKLVPLMEKSKIATLMVKWLMVRPMTAYGKYYYNLGRLGALFAPITKFWLIVFDLLGHRPPYTREGTNETV